MKAFQSGSVNKDISFTYAFNYNKEVTGLYKTMFSSLQVEKKICLCSILDLLDLELQHVDFLKQDSVLNIIKFMLWETFVNNWKKRGEWCSKRNKI